MDSLASVVLRARDGDVEAFGLLVRRFQDMAVGYATSILRDFQLAEDAAQEAFFEAYRNLHQLREPVAFPGWFRRIVFKQCDRIIRRGSLPMLPLEALGDQASTHPGPLAALVQGERKERIGDALNSLPEHERSATLMYYLSGYSQQEVAQFLEVPITTVKKRLFTARQRLQETLMDLTEESLRKSRPSRDEGFANRVIELLKAARAGDLAQVKAMLERDGRLLAARDPFGNTALICAVNAGHDEVAELLLAAGVRTDIYEAAAIGHTDRVTEWLRRDPDLLDSSSPEGFTPLALAAHFGHPETAEFLLSRGADVNRVSKHPIRVAPLHAALFGRRIEMAKLLVARGADVRIRRGGSPWPRAGWTALHYAASLGSTDLVELFLEKGAEIHLRDDEGKTPLSIAAREGHRHVQEILQQHGATE